MKITKKNGNITLYDDEKVIRSILRANAEVPEEQIGENEAAAIADLVFARLTLQNEVITTQNVRDCLCAILRERHLPLTAQRYLASKK